MLTDMQRRLKMSLYPLCHLTKNTQGPRKKIRKHSQSGHFSSLFILNMFVHDKAVANHFWNAQPWTKCGVSVPVFRVNDTPNKYLWWRVMGCFPFRLRIYQQVYTSSGHWHNFIQFRKKARICMEGKLMDLHQGGQRSLLYPPLGVGPFKGPHLRCSMVEAQRSMDTIKNCRKPW